MFENDFMVQFNDEELGECRTYPKNFKGYEQAIKDLKLYKAKQNQRIAELEEQLKNAIVPKFKVGQEVFFKLWDGQEAIGYIIDVQYSTTSGVMYEIHYSDGWESDCDWFEEKDVWSKEEAQSKLEELKGENE